MPHNLNASSTVFWDYLIAATVNINRMVDIEMILINDGGLYADSLAWLYALIERELDCQTVFFWNAGNFFLLAGGDTKDLLVMNRKYRDYIRVMSVYIFGRAINLFPLHYDIV